MEKVTINFRTNPQNVKRLDAIARIEERDRSFLLNKALESYLDHVDWQMEEVKLALAEAKAGKILSEKEFDADMKNW